MIKTDQQVCIDRLKRAAKLLELVRTSRALSYPAIPLIIAAEYLVEESVKIQED